MVPLSVLDLAPIVQGGDAGSSLRQSLTLARHAERLGYRRFWMAEHHSMPGIASSATSVALAHVAAGTETIRVGAGGIMLPNHSPLVIAEQFGTLAALHPGRIDLGLGRAPGGDPYTARALRKDPVEAADRFPHDVVELMRYFEPGDATRRVRAIPGEGEDVPIWILGSSLFGARLAAALGLPYAFASHFAPAQLGPAIEIYRREFEPSAQLERPYLMVAANIFAADTSEEAHLLQSSLVQAFLALRRGAPVQLPPPDPELALDANDMAMLQQTLRYTFAGTGPEVREKLATFAERTGADEVIVTSQVFDPEARLRSFELVAPSEPGVAQSAGSTR
ncbi:MAG: LLM class flavin-dependent oxidoreductase [Sandaracinaceae bacterium]